MEERISSGTNKELDSYQTDDFVLVRFDTTNRSKKFKSCISYAGKILGIQNDKY